MFQNQHPPTPSHLPAGFASPAEDHMEGMLDTQALLVRRPAATFFCRAQGETMRDAGINNGDLLVVDRSITPIDGDVVVANLEGRLTVKYLKKAGTGWALVSAIPDIPIVVVHPDHGVHIWGVVTFAITALCPR